MSAAQPAQSQVRRTVAAAPSRAPQQAAAAPQAHAQAPVQQARERHDFSRPSGEEEIHINLSDIPVMHDTLDVEGLQPSLLSRLLNLVAPIR